MIAQLSSKKYLKPGALEYVAGKSAGKRAFLPPVFQWEI